MLTDAWTCNEKVTFQCPFSNALARVPANADFISPTQPRTRNLTCSTVLQLTQQRHGASTWSCNENRPATLWPGPADRPQSSIANYHGYRP